MPRALRRMRGRHLLVVDLVGIVVAASLALVVRFDGDVEPDLLLELFPLVVALLVVRTAVDIPSGLYGQDWRSASTSELERIVAALALGTILAITLWICSLLAGLSWAASVPRTFWITELLISLAIVGGVRFGIRLATDQRVAVVRPSPGDPRATLLYGAGHAGALIARSALRQPDAGVLPVGFLDDDPTLAGETVAGLRVYGGLAALDRAVAESGARTLLITMPSAPGPNVRRVLETAMGSGLEVRTVPSLTDLLDGTIDAHRIRRVRVEDLLRRPIVGCQHPPEVEAILRDRVVVITGAGGSIGSELARQVHAVRPRHLILVDRAESPLYLVQRELESGPGGGARDSTTLTAELADVADADAMERVIGATRPDVIFHAAAYKHVPLMEAYPALAVQVNAGGTLAVLEAAERAGVERFVFVSTDKAVRPSSVMGASKRVAEMLVAQSACRTGRPYVAVRFGNVLGSNGSVIPIFQAQLEKGAPITITHAAATRYFMTIPEAGWLILDAAAMGRTGGDLFVLDMGEPVRVVDLARDLVRLSGRDPESHPIKVVGLRPGEKLHEQLFYDAEAVERTSSPKVLRVRSEPSSVEARRAVRYLLELARGDDDDALRRALFDVTSGSSEPPVPEGQPIPQWTDRLVPVPVVANVAVASAAMK